MADEKLIFPIGFDLEEGVKEASKEWKNTYQKQLQKAIDEKPLKVKIDFESKGIDTKEFKQWMALAREAEKLERERIKNAKEWQKVADQAAMAETRRTNATNESNARIERANRTAEASERRKRDAVERTNAAYKTQSSYLSRLMQRMVAYASVAQAISFLRNIKDVTAEFELQRVALGSIIGDLNEANAMFEKIKAAAVKSPFQIKELVTYTKQLAAYKIENEELFETTQRLADISAGIGVGMERLVLAYGQIRATGYLRASEVRQLTEAGIPIVEELAKKMSQLRGETVSAADVMQLISERAISFGMVKEVFDDMTSAGGMFYKMQEKQAETLAGQWSNLRDSISIMYEEIGNTEIVNNAMKGMIGLVKSLADNWRTIGIVVGGTLGTFLAMRGVSKMLPDISNYAIRSAKATRQYNRALYEMRIAIQNGDRALISSARSNLRYAVMMRNAEKATTAFGRSMKRLWATLVANPWTAILTVLGALAWSLYSAYENAIRLDKELASIESRGALEGEQQVRNFERLADVIKSSANGSKQQTDAIKELKRSYGDFLPMQDEEIRKLLSTEGGYRAVSSAIREKIALQTQEQKINATTSAFGEDIGRWQDAIRKSLMRHGLSRDEVSRFFAELEKAIKDGVTDINNELPKIFKKATNLDWATETIMARTGASLFNLSYLNNLIDALTDYEEKIKDIESETQASLGALDAYNQRYQDLQKTLSELSSDKPMFSFEWNEDMRTQQIEEYRNAIKELIEEAKSNEGLSQDDYNRLIGMDNLDVVFDTLEEKVPAMASIVRKLRNEWAELMPTSMTQTINAQIISIAKTMGIPMDKVQTLLKQNSEDYATWAQRLKGIFDKSKGDVVAWRNTVNAALRFNPSALEGAQGELEDAEDWKDFLTRLNNAFQFSGGTGGGGRGSRQKDAWVASMEEKIKYMQDFQKGVESLAKTMPRDVAIVREQMIMLNRGVSLGFDPKTMQGSSEELIAWYKKAINDTQKKIQGFKGFRGLTVEQILSKKTTNATVKEYQALLQQLYNALTDFETSQVAKEMEKKIKKLSDDLSRTKTAKEFFDRMLGITGDKELSATLTMSVYGVDADSLSDNMFNVLKSQAETLFEGVDISSAINDDLKTIDFSILDKLVERITAQDMRKQASDFVRNNQKANASWLTDLYKTYEKAMSFEERRTLVMQREAQKRSEIEARADLDDEQKRKFIEASRAQEAKDINAINIEELKASEDWVKTFENIEKVGYRSIKHLMQVLREFIDTNKDLKPEQLKALMSEYDKLYNGLIARNPLEAMTQGTKEYFKALDKARKAGQEMRRANREEERAEQEVASAKAEYDEMSSKSHVDDEVLTHYANKLAKAEERLAKAQTNRAKASKDLRDAQDVQQESLNKVQEALNNTINGYNNLKAVIDSVSDVLDVDEASNLGVALNSVSEALTLVVGVLGAINAVITLIESHPLVLAISAGIMAIVGAIKMFNNLKIRDAEQEIERLDSSLNDLQYAYDRLEKAQEKAFGTDYISNYRRQLENLEAQQEAYLAQANAERSKGKKADEDKIKEYEEQARDTADKIKDMYGSLSEHFLGTDLTSAARDFASAWIEAYKEFSNTTDAMKQKFQDMIQNMVVESLLAKVMEKALEPVFTMIDEMDDGDFYSTSFWQDVMSTMQTATENGVVGAQNIMSMLEQMGINLRGLGGEMTGVSRDIATASEESILGLAAGINTQNFYISQVPTKLDTIIGLLRGDGAIKQGSKITLQDVMIAQNQFLSHLPTIAQHTAETVAECKAIVAETRRTADALDRVIKPDGTRTTYKMNVVTTYQG